MPEACGLNSLEKKTELSILCEPEHICQNQLQSFALFSDIMYIKVFFSGFTPIELFAPKQLLQQHLTVQRIPETAFLAAPSLCPL